MERSVRSYSYKKYHTFSAFLNMSIINLLSAADQRALGMSMRVERASLEQVKIQSYIEFLIVICVPC